MNDLDRIEADKKDLLSLESTYHAKEPMFLIDIMVAFGGKKLEIAALETLQAVSMLRSLANQIEARGIVEVLREHGV